MEPAVGEDTEVKVTEGLEGLEKAPEKLEKKAFARTREIDSISPFTVLNGEITGFSSAYLDQLEEDENGFQMVDLVIPEEVNGVAITSIGDQAFDGRNMSAYPNLKVRSIQLDQAVNLKTIGKFAFDALSSSTTLYGEMEDCELNLPESLESIEGNAFRSQSHLIGDLILPNSLKSIGNSAFEDTGFDGELKLPVNEDFTHIKGQVFSRCNFKGTLDIPENVTVIEGNYAFRNTGFQTVLWSDNITEIGGSAFYECKDLEQVMIKGQETPGTVMLPNKLEKLSGHIFYGCKNLKGSMALPDTLTKVDSEALYGSGIQTVFGTNTKSTVYDPGFLAQSSVTAFVLPTEELYNEAVKSASSTTKSVYTYPVTVTIYDDTSNVVETRDVLYNRPFNFKQDPDTLVWAEDSSYSLPDRGETKVGFDIGWGFSKGGSAIKANSLVTGKALYPTESLMEPELTMENVRKVYDGKPGYLILEAKQPITEVDSDYFFYYYLGSNGSFSNIVHQGTKPIHYPITEVSDNGVYPIQVGLYHKEGGKSVKLWLYNGVAFYPEIMKSDASLLKPVLPETIISHQPLSQVPLSLPEDFPAGTIEWADPDLLVETGTHSYEWIYTPEKPENFTKESFTGTIEVLGVEPAVVTGVSVTPDHAETVPGGQVRFSASVEGSNDPSQEVAWKLDGNTSETTVIGSDGVLTIGADERADQITVTAVSVYDTAFSKQVTVTIQHQQFFEIEFHTQGGEPLETMTGILSGTEVRLPIPVRSEPYLFDGWYTQAEGGEKLGETVILDKNLVLYARWNEKMPKPDQKPDRDPGEDGNQTGDEEDREESQISFVQNPSEDTVTAQLQSAIYPDGTAQAVIPEQLLSDFLTPVQRQTENQETVLPLELVSSSNNVHTVSVTLPQNLGNKMAAANYDWVQLNIQGPDLTVKVKKDMIQTMDQSAATGIRITVGKEQQDHPVAGKETIYQIAAVFEPDGRTVEKFGDGMVEVAVPYTLKEGEAPENLYAFCILPDGSRTIIEASHYDPVTKKIIFRITTPGNYGIGRR